MSIPSPSELQAIAERYERSCTATSHTDLVAPLADIPVLLEAVKEMQSHAYVESLRRRADEKQGAWEHQVLVRADLEQKLAATTATLNARETEFQDARSWRAQLHIATEALAAMTAQLETANARDEATDCALDIMLQREEALLALLDPDEKRVEEVLAIRAKYASSSPIREQLAAMTAKCERLEGVIEQFIDSFKQVWMTSAMERAFNAGLEALRDEPTGGDK